VKQALPPIVTPERSFSLYIHLAAFMLAYKKDSTLRFFLYNNYDIPFVWANY
jgi:hypothetical protein